MECGSHLGDVIIMFKFNFGSEEEAVQEDFTSGAFGSLLPSEEIFITKAGIIETRFRLYKCFGLRFT